MTLRIKTASINIGLFYYYREQLILIKYASVHVNI